MIEILKICLAAFLVTISVGAGALAIATLIFFIFKIQEKISGRREQKRFSEALERALKRNKGE